MIKVIFLVDVHAPFGDYCKNCEYELTAEHYEILKKFCKWV